MKTFVNKIKLANMHYPVILNLSKKLTSQLNHFTSQVVRIYHNNVVVIFHQSDLPNSTYQYNAPKYFKTYHQLLQAYISLFFVRMLFTSFSLFSKNRFYFYLDISLAMVERQGFFDRISFFCAAFPAIFAIYIDRSLYSQPDAAIWSNVYYLVVKNCDHLFESLGDEKNKLENNFWSKLFGLPLSQPSQMVMLIESSLAVSKTMKNSTVQHCLLEQKAANSNEIMYLYKYIYWISPRIRAKIIAIIIYLDLFLGFAFCVFGNL